VQLPDFRAGILIVLGVVSFTCLGERAGLVVASFCCVFIAALGAKDLSWRASLALAGALAVVAFVLFHVLLEVPMPAFPWSPA
jgi:hypothetical protein